MTVSLDYVDLTDSSLDQHSVKQFVNGYNHWLKTYFEESIQKTYEIKLLSSVSLDNDLFERWMDSIYIENEKWIKPEIFSICLFYDRARFDRARATGSFEDYPF